MYHRQLIHHEDLPGYHQFAKDQGWKDAPPLGPDEILRMTHKEREALVVLERQHVPGAYVAYGEAARVYLERKEILEAPDAV